MGGVWGVGGGNVNAINAVRCLPGEGHAADGEGTWRLGLGGRWGRTMCVVESFNLD